MYTMQEACNKTGLSYETLKYYCKQGLVPDVMRDSLNRRIFSEHNIAWINQLNCLKKCGMSMEEMKKYQVLCQLGKKTVAERKAILERKRAELEETRKQIEEALFYIDKKQAFFDNVLTGKVLMND